jgi:methyltransferase family protein
MDDGDVWNERYRIFPHLGSGPGSRGYAARKKNLLVREAIAGHQVGTILDLGCGDMCWMDEEIARLCRYRGLDISEVVVARNREVYPLFEFIVCDLASGLIGPPADLVVSFDVLIHQIREATFRAVLDNTLAVIGRVGLLSYRTPPLSDGRFPSPERLDPQSADPIMVQREAEFRHLMQKEMPPEWPKMNTAFHGPLPELIAALRPDLDVSTAGQYRYQTIYSVRRR